MTQKCRTLRLFGKTLFWSCNGFYDITCSTAEYQQKGVGMLNKLLDYKLLIPLALLLGLAPFFPRPHIVGKLQMLFNGTLRRPIDIFDLFWHAWPFALLACKIVIDLAGRTGKP